MGTDIIYSATHAEREEIENRFLEEKIRQAGIAFPDARRQQHALIVRLDLNPDISKQEVRVGLIHLCSIFEKISAGDLEIDVLQDDGTVASLSLNNFVFTATVGFGAPFFDKLQISNLNRPQDLHSMPSHSYLGDLFPYVLRQTDLIIQLASSSEFVNKWVYEYGHDVFRPSPSVTFNYMKPDEHPQSSETEPADILTAIAGWGHVTDLHIGMQRLDGRNLIGFNDGISNPDRLDMDDSVWIGKGDEDGKYAHGTYMVFQKIEHDLDSWRSLSIETQENLIGRSKGTGLLLGTLPKDEDLDLAIRLHSHDATERDTARSQLMELILPQRNPKAAIFGEEQNEFKNIRDSVPTWSHVRKANPRQSDGSPIRTMFRRGYLYSELANTPSFRSGLLFISFQKNITQGFELIKKKWLNNDNFPVPEARNQFTDNELSERHQKARFTVEEIQALSLEQRQALGLYGDNYDKAIAEAQEIVTQNTGKEGLSAPSKLGIYPNSQFSTTRTLGGGYYFMPSIPNKNLSLIAEGFFE